MPISVVRSIGWLAVALILALAVEGIMRPRGLTLDFANFYDAGQKARAAEFGGLYDPFATIAGQPPFGNMSFFSAPLTSYLYIPLALLPPQLASVCFKLAGTLAELLGLWLLYRAFVPLAGRDAAARAAWFALFAVAALLFQPFWVIYGVGGQTTPFVFLMLVLAYRCLQHSQFGQMALLISAVVVIKPAFAPAALLLFIMLPNRFRLVAMICAVGFGVGSFWLLGAELHRQFLVLIVNETSGLLAPWRNSNPFSWVEPLFVDPAAYDAPGQLPQIARRIGLALRILASTGLIIAMILQRRQVLKLAASNHVIFVTALMLAIVFSPVVWAHYLTLMFIPVAALIALRRHLPGLAVVMLTIAVVAAVGQNLILLKALIRLVGTVGQTALAGHACLRTLPDQGLTCISQSAIVALAVLKSLPALLILVVTLGTTRAIGRTLADSTWVRVSE